jgi:hypothetical protein
VKAAHPEVAGEAKSCKLCGAGPFSGVGNFNKHKRLHDPDATWSCATAGCGGVFGTKTDLAHHVYQQHPPARIFCTEAHVAGCGPDSRARAGPPLADRKPRGFGLAGDLKGHINSIHRGIKHNCPCGKEFTTPHGLRKHQKNKH